MRNAESKMRNRKCGMTLIGRTVKPRDRCHSAYYCKSEMTSQTGRAVKCGMRKMQTMMQDCVVDRPTHCKSLANALGLCLSLLTLQFAKVPFNLYMT